MNKLVSLIAFFAGVSASAAPASNPEFLHQAPLGAMELTPAISYRQYKFGLKNGLGDVDVKGFRETVQFESGLSDMISAGLLVGYHSLKSTSSNFGGFSATESGLEDLQIFMRGRADSPTGSLRYGLNASFGLEKMKNESNGDSNASSGGIALAPFLGYEAMVGQGVAGARVTYKFLVADRKGQDTSTAGNTTDFKITGGNVLTTDLFFEMPLPSGILGFAYSMDFRDKTKRQVSGGSKVDNSASLSEWSLAAYVPIDVSPSLRILPALRYGQYSAFDTTGVDSVSIWTADVGARFTF